MIIEHTLCMNLSTILTISTNLHTGENDSELHTWICWLTKPACWLILRTTEEDNSWHRWNITVHISIWKRPGHICDTSHTCWLTEQQINSSWLSVYFARQPRLLEGFENKLTLDASNPHPNAIVHLTKLKIKTRLVLRGRWEKGKETVIKPRAPGLKVALAVQIWSPEFSDWPGLYFSLITSNSLQASCIVGCGLIIPPLIGCFVARHLH